MSLKFIIFIQNVTMFILTDTHNMKKKCIHSKWKFFIIILFIWFLRQQFPHEILQYITQNFQHIEYHYSRIKCSPTCFKCSLILIENNILMSFNSWCDIHLNPFNHHYKFIVIVICSQCSHHKYQETTMNLSWVMILIVCNHQYL